MGEPRAGVDEAVGEGSRVSPGDDLDRRGIGGKLSQRHGEELDMVGGRVRPGVPGPQDPSERFAGGVEEREQRVVPEPPFRFNAAVSTPSRVRHAVGVDATSPNKGNCWCSKPRFYQEGSFADASPVSPSCLLKGAPTRARRVGAAPG